MFPLLISETVANVCSKHSCWLRYVWTLLRLPTPSTVRSVAERSHLVPARQRRSPSCLPLPASLVQPPPSTTTTSSTPQRAHIPSPLHLHRPLRWSRLRCRRTGLKPQWPLEGWRIIRGHQSCSHNSVYCGWQGRLTTGAAVIPTPCRSPEQRTRK